MRSRAGLLLLILLMASTAHAKRFRNAYVSFELPPNWNCKLEGSEWVCENDFSTRTKEAIIILTAKEVGPSDTLPAYLAHLQTPRTIVGRGAVSSKSKIIHVKERMINNHLWVDGMHEGSEVGPYFTRYVATIKEKIAVLVTFSAHKEHYPKYSGDFIRAIESLTVVASKDTMGGAGGGGGELSRPNSGTIGVPIGESISAMGNEAMPSTGSGGKTKTYQYLLALALIIGAAAGYIYLKSRKTRPPPPPPRKSSKK